MGTFEQEYADDLTPGARRNLQWLGESLLLVSQRTSRVESRERQLLLPSIISPCHNSSIGPACMNLGSTRTLRHTWLMRVPALIHATNSVQRPRVNVDIVYSVARRPADSLPNRTVSPSARELMPTSMTARIRIDQRVQYFVLPLPLYWDTPPLFPYVHCVRGCT